MRPVVLLVTLSACGRLGFDEHIAGVTGDGPLGDGVQQGDGASSSNAMLVQQSGVVSGNGSVMVALPQPTLGGTFLVATIAGNDLSTFMAPSGWQNNASGSTSGACASAIVTEQNAPAGQSTITFTINTPCDVQVTEWRGLANVDNGGFASGTASTSLSVSTFTADSAAGDLAIASFCQDTTMPTYAAGAGWNALGQIARSAALPSMMAEYQTGEPKAKITATATSSLAAKYTGTIVTFQAP
ncbi:MAG: hypothetical protein JO257_09850 [Deltaproteobacteria bacterium]|nr:hypothetical protein [Deltaproteobacteria bacterium]